MRNFVVTIILPIGDYREELIPALIWIKFDQCLLLSILPLCHHHLHGITDRQQLSEGRKPSKKIIQIEGDIPVGMEIDIDIEIEIEIFTSAVHAKLWEKVGRINLCPFEEAREFIQSVKLKKHADWREFTRSGNLPEDRCWNGFKIIPSIASMNCFRGTIKPR